MFNNQFSGEQNGPDLPANFHGVNFLSFYVLSIIGDVLMKVAGNDKLGSTNKVCVCLKINVEANN